MKTVHGSLSFCRYISTRVRPNPKDVFGKLTQTSTKSLEVDLTDKYYPSEPDNYDKEEYDLTPRKNAYYYKYEISKHARQGSQGLRKALELFQQMKVKDRLQPESENFAPLIYGCARAGYTKKAFELYEEATKYIKKPAPSMVTCLINACAESPYQEYGYERLNWFMRHVKVSYSYNFNILHYNCAIKAYGKLGHLDKAIALVKDMGKDSIVPNIDTFNNLLIGCASDRERGTTIALRLFKRLRYFGLQPDNYVYNLMLRCIRDCKMGSSELIKETLAELPALTSFEKRLKYKLLIKKKLKDKMSAEFEWLPALTDLASYLESAITNSKPHQDQKLIEGGKNDASNKLLLPVVEDESFMPTLFCESTKLPNLLSDEHLALMNQIESIDMEKLDTPHGRLMLFGGMHGYLETMTETGCKPERKTLSLILCCLPHEISLTQELFRLSEDYSIERSLSFYDLLIGHLCRSSSKRKLEVAKVFLDKMHLDGLRPNISTLEALSMGCAKLQDAERLLNDIKASGFQVTDKVLFNLLHEGLRRYDFEYANAILSECLESGARPTRAIVDLIEIKRMNASEFEKDHNKGLSKVKQPRFALNEQKLKHFGMFKKLTEKWLKSVELDDDHPWQQFEVPNISKRGPSEGSIREILKPMIAQRVKNFPQFHESDHSEAKKIASL